MKFGKKQQLYRVDLPKGTFSGKSMPEVLDLLAQGGFEPIDDLPDEAVSRGFVSALDETKGVKDDGIAFGDFWIAGFRTDQRKVDKKAAKVLLDREIRNSNHLWDKTMRKDKLEEITMSLLRKAVPIPSVQIMAFDPEGDTIYFTCPTTKKAEDLFEHISQILGIGYAGVDFAEPEGDEDERRAFLEHLWIASKNGRGLLFEPKSVAGEESTTQSTDETDLAFGRVNGKKCSSGSLTLENGVRVDLKSPTFHALRISLDIPDAEGDSKEDRAANLLGVLMGFYKETFERIRAEYANFRSSPGEGGEADEIFEQAARTVLGR